MARAAQATIMATHPEVVVAVVYDGATANGIHSNDVSFSGLGESGDRGKQSGVVRLDASKLARPPDGATIIVDGETATVTQTRLDPTGALLAIEYQVTKPITEG
uniref:Tail protein n=1 Tax=viral metagenome TaxID=1070528 RepID=A0A6M3LTB5_9ZZZZ